MEFFDDTLKALFEQLEAAHTFAAEQLLSRTETVESQLTPVIENPIEQTLAAPVAGEAAVEPVVEEPQTAEELPENVIKFPGPLADLTDEERQTIARQALADIQEAA